MEKRCPSCGNHYGDILDFCPEDGAPLEAAPNNTRTRARFAACRNTVMFASGKSSAEEPWAQCTSPDAAGGDPYEGVFRWVGDPTTQDFWEEPQVADAPPIIDNAEDDDKRWLTYDTFNADCRPVMMSNMSTAPARLWWATDSGD